MTTKPKVTTVKTVKTVTTPKTPKTVSVKLESVFEIKDLSKFTDLEELRNYGLTLPAHKCVTMALVAHKVAIVAKLRELESVVFESRLQNSYESRLFALVRFLLATAIEGTKLNQTEIGKITKIAQGTVSKFKTASAFIELTANCGIKVELTATLQGIDKGKIKASTMHKMPKADMLAFTKDGHAETVAANLASGADKRKGTRPARPNDGTKGKTSDKGTTVATTVDDTESLRAYIVALPALVNAGNFNRDVIVEALQTALAELEATA